MSKFLLFLTVFALVASLSGCATVKPVAEHVAAGVIDCFKPEITAQIPNAIASVNKVLAEPSTLTEVKNQEIRALLSGRDELIACTLRQVISDLRDAFVSGKRDSSVNEMERDAVGIIRGNAYKYSDGWENLSTN